MGWYEDARREGYSNPSSVNEYRLRGTRAEYEAASEGARQKEKERQAWLDQIHDFGKNMGNVNNTDFQTTDTGGYSSLRDIIIMVFALILIIGVISIICMVLMSNYRATHGPPDPVLQRRLGLPD